MAVGMIINQRVVGHICTQPCGTPFIKSWQLFPTNIMEHGLDAVMADELEDDSRCLNEVASFNLSFMRILDSSFAVTVTTCWQLDFHVLTDKQTG